MAEFTYNPVQEVTAGGAIIFNTSISCPKHYVIHRNNPQSCFARYQVAFNGNIAVPAGGSAGPISLALAINGEPLLTSQAIVTPPAADQYFNVTSTAFITVPTGCCFTLAVENTSADAINVQNANLVITRVA